MDKVTQTCALPGCLEFPGHGTGARTIAEFVSHCVEEAETGIHTVLESKSPERRVLDSDTELQVEDSSNLCLSIDLHMTDNYPKQREALEHNRAIYTRLGKVPEHSGNLEMLD